MRSEGYCTIDTIHYDCTVVVPCVRVCLSVRSCLPPRASRPRNIYRYVRIHRDTGKTFIILIFAKNARSEAAASFICLECHQLHLSPKRRIPKESAEGWKDIDSRYFSFVQKLRYLCLPPSCAYPQYKYAYVRN